MPLEAILRIIDQALDDVGQMAAAQAGPCPLGRGAAAGLRADASPPVICKVTTR